MTLRINFTKKALEGLLDQHDGERLVIYDRRQPGLLAELRAGGTMSFYLYRWADGRPHRIRIGAFPIVTVDAARDKAKLLLAELVKGIDVAEVKRERRQEATLADLFEHWLQHAKQHKRTWPEDERQFKTLLGGWKTRRLSSIKRADVQARHAAIGKAHGKYAANRAMALLAAMFNKAGDVGFTGANPCDGVKRFRETKRDRFLQPAELPAFFAAVKAEPNRTIADFFLACLYTGARKSNVCSMRWADVNLEAATWRIPQTKNNDPVLVHLSAPALVLLQGRREIAEDDAAFVFPGRRSGGQLRHLSSPKAAWARLVKKAKLDDLRLHDLRRTLGSFQAAAGSSLLTIGKSLGHRSTASTAIYARMNLDPVRASVDLATAAIVAAGNKEA